MLTRTLIAALDKAQGERSVRAVTWALEKTTGMKTQEVLERKWVGYGYGYGSGRTSTPFTLGDQPGNIGSLMHSRERLGYPSIDAITGGYGSAALQSAAVYACVKIISEDIGSLPFFWYERSEDGTRVDKKFGARYRLLHNLANPDTSSGEFREALTAHCVLYGNGYAKKEFTRSSGELMWLWQLNPNEVRTEVNQHKQLFYIHKEGNLAEKTYTRDEIFHLKGFTMDGLHGDPILERARAVIGLTLDSQKYAQRFFTNDASAGVYLTRPLGAPGIGAEGVSAIKKAWKEWHQGLGRSHEPAILQEGMTAERNDPDLEKLQMIEQRKFQVIEICRLLRMTPHKLADLDRATFSNIEHLAMEYVSHTLSPWCRRWREAVHRCILTREEQIEDRLYAELYVEALLRGDFKTQTDGYARMLEKGVYKINEVRRWQNLNPIPGGDEAHIQLNMQPVADIGKEEEAAALDAAQPIQKLKSYVNGAYTA